MTLHVPLFLQPSGADPDITPTAQEFRRFIEAISPIGRQGVVGAGDMLVAQRAAGANFSVDIAAGLQFIVGDDITSQGVYHAWNDAVVNVVVPAAPGSGTRVHRVVTQVRDKLSNGAYSTYDAQFQLLADTGGGTPAEPNSAASLALVSVAAGDLSVVNAKITDVRARQGAGPFIAVKPADTSRTNNASRTADPHLFLPVAANAVYSVDLMCQMDGSSGTDFGFNWAAPASASFTAIVSGLQLGAANANADQFFSPADSSPWSGAVGLIGAGNSIGFLLRGTLITGSASGIFQFNWAQQTSGATSTILHKGSTLTLIRAS